MAPTPDPVARIDAITRNARTTWFALLSLELFIAITLMRVEHVDFYGVNRATQLPVLNIGVPTFLFFYAAPVLLAASFGFFHLYLIRLSDALSNAPSRVGGQRLGDAIAPWLVNDAALHLRHILRRDYCTTPRALDWTSTLLTFALNWGLGLGVIAAIWWVSMPARNIVMTGIAAACTLACLFIGGESALQFHRRMKEAGGAAGLTLHARLPNPVKALAFVASLAGLGFVTYARTMEPPGGLSQLHHADQQIAPIIPAFAILIGGAEFPATWLAPVAMPNEAIAQRPPGWLPYQEARLDYLATWCRREGLTCASSGPLPDGFAAAWKIRRDAAIAEQLKPRWHKRPRKPNWTDANLAGAYLTGVNLSGAQMQRANLIEAQMEGAILIEAHMQGAALGGAQMEGANLSEAQMQRASLFRAQMEGAILSGAQMEGAGLVRAQMAGATLIEAQMQGADLSEAQMQGADLSGAQMEGANLNGAQMEGADLNGAQMEGADLNGAQMEGAVLSRAQMQGADFREAQMQEADLSGAQMQGANFIEAQLEGADLRGAQMDEANLGQAQMAGALLSDAQMRRANLVEAQLQRANLVRARMQGAVLDGARMEGANLGEARMEGTDLILARMDGADLTNARMERTDPYMARMDRAVLNLSHLVGSQEQPTRLHLTNLSETINEGGALRFVDMQVAIFNHKTDWRNAFLDGSVAVTREFRARAENPCQWTNERLTDAAFYGRWRWWLEKHPDSVPWHWIAPEAWRDVPVNPGPANCDWKYGPINGPR